MIKLGYFIHKTPTGRLLVKMTTMKPPRMGSIVVDSGGREVGILVDVIGPVRSPYAIVKPLREDVEVDPHSVLFVKPKPKRRRRVRK